MADLDSKIANMKTYRAGKHVRRIQIAMYHVWYRSRKRRLCDIPLTMKHINDGSFEDVSRKVTIDYQLGIPATLFAEAYNQFVWGYNQFHANHDIHSAIPQEGIGIS